jgi:hypothetical protein
MVRLDEYLTPIEFGYLEQREKLHCDCLLLGSERDGTRLDFATAFFTSSRSSNKSRYRSSRDFFLIGDLISRTVILTHSEHSQFDRRSPFNTGPRSIFHLAASDSRGDGQAAARPL